MFAYWLLFAYFATGAAFSGKRDSYSAYERLTYVFGGLFIAVMIGVRYRVGADWETYVNIFRFAGLGSAREAMEQGDPAYQLLNWVIRRAGGDIWQANLVCGAIFSWSLLRFASTHPLRWLGVLVAIPYMVIVVAMGYTRQSVALAILMAGLAAVQRGGSTTRYALYTAAAALFHRTAVIGFPPVALSAGRNKLVNLLLAVAGGFILYEFFLSEKIPRLVENYFDARYSSQGAAIRVAMNVVPAVIFLLFRKKLLFTPKEESIWRVFSWLALAFIPLLLILPSTTVVDRMALYVMPLQIAVFCRVPGTLIKGGFGIFLVITYCFIVQFAWLNFAAHARYWIPYEVAPALWGI